MGRSGGQAVTAATSLVLDSHVFIWYVLASPRLSDTARQIMDDATHSDIPLVISAATLVELVYLVKKGTFMQTHLEAFHEIIDATGSGFEVAPIDNAVARAVSGIPRAAVTDPFDWIIAATALVRATRLVTYDHKIHQFAAVETSGKRNTGQSHCRVPHRPVRGAVLCRSTLVPPDTVHTAPGAGPSRQAS